mmetsp:Transcript_12609/g.29470  ORF Transcript_12609/g.29470 Transcript_12609/m.29470 type:complete len:317 (-) Transcript_12609:335-1285(-)
MRREGGSHASHRCIVAPQPKLEAPQRMKLGQSDRIQLIPTPTPLLSETPTAPQSEGNPTPRPSPNNRENHRTNTQTTHTHGHRNPLNRAAIKHIRGGDRPPPSSSTDETPTTPSWAESQALGCGANGRHLEGHHVSRALGFAGPGPLPRWCLGDGAQLLLWCGGDLDGPVVTLVIGVLVLLPGGEHLALGEDVRRRRVHLHTLLDGGEGGPCLLTALLLGSDLLRALALPTLPLFPGLSLQLLRLLCLVHDQLVLLALLLLPARARPGPRGKGLLLPVWDKQRRVLGHLDDVLLGVGIQRLGRRKDGGLVYGWRWR